MPRNTRRLARESFRGSIGEYARVLPRYEKYADVLRRTLEDASKLYAPDAIVQTRVKSVASFAEKMLRKSPKYADPVKEITDLCGARVITRTRDDARAMCDFVKRHFDIDSANSVDKSQLLRPQEFGYRSVHYIVSFKRGVSRAREIKSLFGLKAEIQVRTVLEHAWSDVQHDIAYKSVFEMPEKWRRELHALAAVLETTDGDFSRIQDGLRTYAASYGSYMTCTQMEEEIDRLEIVLEYDPENAQLAARIGKLAITLGDWRKAIEVLSRHVATGYQPILRDLGVATCKLHESRPRSAKYKEGQRYLEASCAALPSDVDAITSLAGTWKNIDSKKAHELRRRAYETDPSDPYALGNYLVYEIARERDISPVSCMAPVIQTAIRRCQDQVEVGMNMPWAYYSMGMFLLLLGRPYESLAAHCKALRVSVHDWMVQTSLRSLEKLAVVRDRLPGYEWVRGLLLLGWAGRSHTAARAQVKKLASDDCRPIRGPVVIVAGGCSDTISQGIERYRKLITGALKDFNGTIISGGTRAGIGGVVGDVQEKYRETIHTIGYRPKRLPSKLPVDRRYAEIRRTDGDAFSPLEPLQAWADLLASGIDPSQVRLLGVGGGDVAAAEYRIALALGARVAVLIQSGGEADKLVQDRDWRDVQNPLPLPADMMTVKAYVGSGNLTIDSDIRETIARAVHAAYRCAQAKRKTSEDPAMVDWDELSEDLRESNREQADHFPLLLRKIGCSVCEVTDREIALMRFTPREVETMAEMEHGRWTVERLLDGWRLGPQREVTKKISPHLVGWDELPDEVREWDREAVRKIPALLATVGLEIRRQP